MVKTSYSWAIQFFSAFITEMINCQNLSYEERLPEKWLFLNTDGVVWLELGNATFREIISDENGDYVSKYKKYLGKWSIFYAKL